MDDENPYKEPEGAMPDHTVLRLEVQPPIRPTPSHHPLPSWLTDTNTLTEPLRPNQSSLLSPYTIPTAPLCCTTRTFFKWLIGYLVAVSMVAIIGTQASVTAAVVILALLPNVFILSYLLTTYRKSTLVVQGLATLLEAVVIMCPLVIAENMWNDFIFTVSKLPEGDPTSDTPPPKTALYVLGALIASYTVAGFFEEMVKYLALRRALFHPHITDPRAVIVYGAFAGSAFEIVENLAIYDLAFGLGTSIVRSLLPLHVLTAMISGVFLAHKKFAGYNERWYVTILLPMFVHGTFDWLLAIAPTWLAPICAFAICLMAFLYVRRETNGLSKRFPVEEDVHMALANGFVERRAVPTWRYLLLLACVCPLTTLLFVAIISLLVPRQMHAYIERRMSASGASSQLTRGLNGKVNAVGPIADQIARMTTANKQLLQKDGAAPEADEDVVPVADIRYRVISASAGAIITSFVTNPLDVVKTRMQAHVPPMPSSSAAAGVPMNRCHSGVDSMGGNLFYTPTRAATTAAVPYGGTLETLVQVGKHEGLRGLYRGLGPSLAMAVPSTVVYYSFYDTLRARLASSGWGPIMAPLLGGSISRVLAATVTAPLELIRTRAQADREAVTIAEGMAGVVRERGWLSLWHGLGAQLWRDVPFSAIYWLGYEQLVISMNQNASEPHSTYMAKSFVAGCGAGMVAAFVTTPFDVIKTRRQVSLMASPGLDCGPLTGTNGSGRMLSALQEVLRVEGFTGLFSGWLPRVLRVGPACAVMITTYEGGKRILAAAEKGKL